MAVSEIKESKKENRFELDYETLKTILDNSFDEIYVTNADGVVVYVNKASERLYGMKPSELIGKTSQEVSEINPWSPRLSPMVLQKKRRLTIEQKTCFGKTLVTTATPVFDDNGNIKLIIENSRDITESEGFKQELEITKQLLKQHKQEVEVLRKKELNIPDFIARSKEMKDILKLVRHVALVDSTILLLGESGTGKGVLAKHIHKISNRKDGPFITINCAAIPEELIESELFGYERGAFTGADGKGKIGLIELANNGTLFLDEIGEISLKLQAKLLQVIQENKFYPVGGREVKNVNCRIIAATNRDLQKVVKEGRFREDLYYRLNVIEIKIPPLRERSEDIVPLIYYFLNKYDKKYKFSHEISQECMDILLQYSWPGNVRQLENLIERLVVTVQDTVIDTCHLPKVIYQAFKPQNYINFPVLVPLEEAVEEVEKKLIIKAYKQLGSSYKVAKALNISQSKASRLIRKYCKDE